MHQGKEQQYVHFSFTSLFDVLTFSPSVLPPLPPSSLLSPFLSLRADQDGRLQTPRYPFSTPFSAPSNAYLPPASSFHTDFIEFYSLRSYDRINNDPDRIRGMAERSGVTFEEAQAALARYAFLRIVLSFDD